MNNLQGKKSRQVDFCYKDHLLMLTQYRTEFARHLAVEKRDFAAIEFLLRKGRRQLELYASPGIKDVR